MPTSVAKLRPHEKARSVLSEGNSLTSSLIDQLQQTLWVYLDKSSGFSHKYIFTTELSMDGDIGGSMLWMDCSSESPNEAALLALMERTGYSMVQENGQRKFGGPPPGWDGPPPPRGCEVFVGKIPRDMYEDELVPVFERAGRIYEFRLMMEFSGENRGYAFVMYTTREGAQRAIHLLDNHEIHPRICSE
ncbi:hypothetical protein UPYG_G00245550 [Umbra pygmaea]|uniref:RRM domain-containing protein n=1 Tax=Umbra pygmaea TaxID=75934 RepID=A0ABD0WG70_UMBPY